MKLDRFIRIAIGVLLALVFVIAIAALVFITESALNVWARLLEGPRWLLYGYVMIMASLVVIAIWLVIRLVVRRKPRREAATPKPMSREDIERRLADADRAGVEVAAAQSELRELAARQASGTVHLCFFGEISTGKSSLIKALVPEAEVRIDAVGGSTREIRHYRWRDAEGAGLLLTDVPGTAGTDPALDRVAAEEARRAHVVLFVSDGDLTRAEKDALRWLLDLGKPVILVMNKSDRYTAAEQALLMQRLIDHLMDLGGAVDRDRVVAVSAGGETEVIEQREGGETRTRRRRPADIGVLVVAINRLVERGVVELDARRDRAVFQLAAEKLAEAEARYRQQRSEQIVRSATRKAVIGSLAAVSPGTDVIIQGYIATTMTKELCGLYDVAPRDLDVEEFLSLSQSRVGRALPLALAVAGNALKAFPGLGTVAGGLVHAVAYGLIFDALGRSLTQTLTRYGELDPALAAREFEENIGEHIEAGVRKVAEMALEQESGSGRGD
ncbi:MAG: 50S ribosome-binding GTPase [Gammaproteobacteria bacterium]|nr:50S ribosome-binding GTPase [Gammaproteobacteria bacterium]MDH4253111.1 50S ribosome-binding GTPase [Gammaproteobacteria bacterium]MDH5308937.1 50S ribosome-binding GTPase [Gammaproteobacteria bacterium]